MDKPNKFQWEKYGQIFSLSDWNSQSSAKSQAQNPYALVLEDRVRVYFNTRTNKDSLGQSKSFPAYVDFDRADLSTVINCSLEPLLEWGGIGDFDEFGIMSGSVYQIEDRLLMYYVGWSRMVSVPYNWSIGVAESLDGGDSFKKSFRGPIISNTEREPFLQAGCSSLLKRGDTYYLWYTSGLDWLKGESKPESMYQIMCAKSKDGLNWERDAKVLINPKLSDEAQASPTVFEKDGIYHMFFSYRHSLDFRNRERGYRIGYAYSQDLVTWERNDELAGITTSDNGWDSEMVCFPSVIEVNNKIYLFYSGNNFGESGVGIAEIIL